MRRLVARFFAIWRTILIPKGVRDAEDEGLHQIEEAFPNPGAEVDVEETRRAASRARREMDNIEARQRALARLMERRRGEG